MERTMFVSIIISFLCLTRSNGEIEFSDELGSILIPKIYNSVASDLPATPANRPFTAAIYGTVKLNDEIAQKFINVPLCSETVCSDGNIECINECLKTDKIFDLFLSANKTMVNAFVEALQCSEKLKSFALVYDGEWSASAVVATSKSAHMLGLSVIDTQPGSPSGVTVTRVESLVGDPNVISDVAADGATIFSNMVDSVQTSMSAITRRSIYMSAVHSVISTYMIITNILNDFIGTCESCLSGLGKGTPVGCLKLTESDKYGYVSQAVKYSDTGEVMIAASVTPIVKKELYDVHTPVLINGDICWFDTPSVTDSAKTEIFYEPLCHEGARICGGLTEMERFKDCMNNPINCLFRCSVCDGRGVCYRGANTYDIQMITGLTMVVGKPPRTLDVEDFGICGQAINDLTETAKVINETNAQIFQYRNETIFIMDELDVVIKNSSYIVELYECLKNYISAGKIGEIIGYISVVLAGIGLLLTVGNGGVLLWCVKKTLDVAETTGLMGTQVSYMPPTNPAPFATPSGYTAVPASDAETQPLFDQPQPADVMAGLDNFFFKKQSNSAIYL